jgi:hypothetical protein
MEEDTIVTDEKCSICEELLKDGEGRFRTPNRSYCTSCFYKRNRDQHAEVEEKWNDVDRFARRFGSVLVAS